MRRLIAAFVLFVAFVLPALAADDRAAAERADRAWLAALTKGDSAAAGALLDAAATWTDGDGATRSRAQILGDLGKLKPPAGAPADLQEHFYGRLYSVRGAHDKTRFLRVWVKRGSAWKMFVAIDTPVAPRTGQASVEAAAGEGDCDNPCRTVPYTPKTEMDRAILATWQATKYIEWKPHAASWERYIGDEFMIINNSTVRNKPERVAIAKKQQDAGTGAPGDPIIDMSILDVGDNAAVMISRHFPYRGGKPYRNIRIWALRDNRWQLAISQQSADQAAAPMAAVAAKK
jgi:hypothetical protein